MHRVTGKLLIRSAPPLIREASSIAALIRAQNLIKFFVTTATSICEVLVQEINLPSVFLSFFPVVLMNAIRF